MPGHRRAVTALLAVATMLPGSVIAQSPDPVQSADPSGSPVPGQSAGVAIPAGPTLRVVVAPLIAPLVDVYLDGVPLTGLEDFATGSVSVSVPAVPGAHNVDILADGSDPLRTTALATALVDFGEAGARTMAVRGDGTALVLDDAVTPPLTGASLRLVNLDTDAGVVDAWLGDESLVLGLSPDLHSARLEIPAGTHTLTANAPDDRLSLFASEDILFVEGSAVTAFMVPTSERAVWFLAVDASPAIGSDASASPGASLVPGPSIVSEPSTVPEPSTAPLPRSTADPDALAWRILPAYECELMIAFTTDFESTSTRPTGSARVQVPASLRGGLALFHYPVMSRGDPLSGWSLGPDGWTCVRHLAGDFDTSVSGLTIRSAGAGRAAAAACGAFGCEPAVGARTGRFIAYGSSARGGFEDPAAIDHGASGTAACAYHRRFRSEGYTECRGVAARDGRRNVPRRTADGSVWLGFSRARSGDTVVGAVGIDCGRKSCTPHLIECKLRPEDRAVCSQSLQVMLDPDRVRVPRIDANLACPGSVTLIRAGSGSAPPEDFRRARVVRTLRGDHDLVVDAVPVSSVGTRGAYPRICGGGPDRLWHRVRSVDGDRVNGWIAMPLVRPVGD